jgi:hypothetical protein
VIDDALSGRLAAGEDADGQKDGPLPHNAFRDGCM